MGKYILSIDQGTTSCRAIIFDKDGRTMGVAQKEFTQYFPSPGWVEHDAEEIWNTQVTCIKESVRQAGLKPEEIAAIGITNQRETTVVWDRITGKPIYPAIVWQCRRTQELADKLREESNVFREKTGLVPDAYFSGPKIKWILDNVADACQQAEAGNLLFGTIDSWLIWNLTKEKAHVTEPSNASRTMLFNLKTLDWDEELLRRLEIPRTMMPQVLDSNACFGVTSKELVGFEAPVAAVLGDQQAALFGQACLSEGMSKCTYGTGSFLLVNTGQVLRLVPGLLTTLAWKLSNMPAVYALEGAVFIAGAAVQWLRDGLGIIEHSEQAETMATSLGSNEGVYFVPAFVGMGSPWWDSDMRGTVIGLTRGSNRTHLVRAALEAMAYQVKDVAMRMHEHAFKITELRVDGGAARNDFMLQFQADLLDAPVARSKQTEATAWGVAALAGMGSDMGSGIISGMERLKQIWQRDIVFEPGPDRSKDYAGWQTALKAARVVAKAGLNK